MRLRKLIIVGAILGALCVLFGYKTAQGGWKQVYDEVYISTQWNYAYGSLGLTRNSTDGNQYIGCGRTTNNWGGDVAFCYAADRYSTYRTCSTSDPVLMAIISTINDDSRVGFDWDPNTGICYRIDVRNASQYPPRAP